MTKSATPLVLIAGTGGTQDFWDPVTELLALQPAPLAVTSVGDDPVAIAAEVLAAARRRGFGRFHVVGDSLGAVIATQLAASHPHTVESLLLLNGWARTDLRMQAEFALWDSLLAVDPGLFARYLPLIAFGPGWWDSLTSRALAETVRLLASVIPADDMRRQLAVDREVDVRPLLGDITAPTTVVASRHDRLIPCSQARELVAGIDGARLWVIDTGHGSVIEDPAVVADAIRTHLDGTGTER